MKLYLVRHAERGHGADQDTLTDRGLSQAEALVNVLGAYPIKKVYCSSANRARLTIKPFLEKFRGEVVYTPDLEELRLGVLQGKTGEEFRSALSASGLSKEEFRPEGGENCNDFRMRVKRFIVGLKDETVENILICTHAGVIRLFLEFVKGINPKEIKTPEFASITEICLSKGHRP